MGDKYEKKRKRVRKMQSLKKSAPTRPQELISTAEPLPPDLFLLPVSQISMFPGMIIPVILPRGKLAEAVEEVLEGAGLVGVVLAKVNGTGETPDSSSSMIAMGSPGDSPVDSGAMRLSSEHDEEMEFFEYGIAAKVLKKINLPDDQVSVLLSGIQRFKIGKMISRKPYHVANVEYLPDKVEKGLELEALLRTAIVQFKELSKNNPLISEEIRVALVNIDGPERLCDLMASVLVHDVETYQQLLAAADVKNRLQHLLRMLKKELDLQAVQKKIHDGINQKIAKAQREYYLQEQLKAIQKELGMAHDERSRLKMKFEERLKSKDMSEDVTSRIDEEFEKLESLHEQSSEYSVSINYLDWATSLPWGERSKENYDIKGAKAILDSDHFGLKEAKERILEFLAVRKLKKSSEGSIICFVGPPGTGKTSLGKSIAEALNRKFFRFSVGGMRDEAEIKGHRRTYVGAMPGKIIQGLKRIGTQNPVFLIDEVDKISTGWASGGDPASALLEVLDLEQNKEFLDYFLDIPFDCSEVMFITTANTIDTIPKPLYDRMEIIPLHGYSDSEKYNIARKHLLPRQLKKHALKSSNIQFKKEGLNYIISHYARESGVRGLEKAIARICRKVAYRLATGKTAKIEIAKPKIVETYLGMPPFTPDVGLDTKMPGTVRGLAWTEYGGEVLFVESSLGEGKGGFKLTGSLGEVMQESANIAYTFIANQCKGLKLPEDFFDTHKIHLHVPAGATPKDGPSAGITMAASLYSLLTKKVARPSVAMTGELTLSGRILPVGGIKEKLLAAQRAGVKTILLPKPNERDLKEIEPEIKKGLKITPVATMREALQLLFR